jgi:hypothetical protein
METAPATMPSMTSTTSSSSSVYPVNESGLTGDGLQERTDVVTRLFIRHDGSAIQRLALKLPRPDIGVGTFTTRISISPKRKHVDFSVNARIEVKVSSAPRVAG